MVPREQWYAAAGAEGGRGVEREQAVVLIVSSGDFARFALTSAVEQCGCQGAWLAPGLEWPIKLRHLAPEVIVADAAAKYLPGVMRRNPGVPLILAAEPGRRWPDILQPVFHVIGKPVTPAQVTFAVGRALAYRRLALDCWENTGGDLAPLLGASEPMQEVYDRAEAIAEGGTHMLIVGERGTGKAQLARAVHVWGPRGRGRIHLADCRGVREDTYVRRLFAPLLASDRKCSTTHNGSTLVLGDVGTLCPFVQRRLLAVLQERRIRLSDGAKAVDLDVRVVATTGQSPERLTETRGFLPELLELFRDRTLAIPSLRERKEDIAFLARRLVADAEADPALGPVELPAETEARLHKYVWPGNVRGLRSVLARAVVLAEDRVRPEDVDVPSARDYVRAEPARDIIRR